jgi:hypothetical protein
MPNSDSSDSDGGAQQGKSVKKLVGRIKKHHRLEMEAWLSLDRVYSGGKNGAKQKNIRWCLGGGEKGVKGMTDSKECKSSGAFERMANHMNRTFGLKGAELWTSAIAEARFKNIMKSFRDACRKNPLPREKDFGADKNAYAAALDLCEDKRKKKCSSYIALWIACGLKDHPKYSPAGKMESSCDGDSMDDFEEPRNQRVKGEDDAEDSKTGSDAESFSSDSSGEGSQPDDGDKKDQENPTSPMVARPQGAASPRSQTSPGVKRGGSPKRKVIKRKKFSLKKQKSTTKHQDIVEAYLLCKKQQNDHFLQLSILSQRRQIFFECWDRQIRNMQDVQRVYETIGIGTVPGYLFQPLPESAGELNEDEEEGEGEDREENFP